MWEYRVVRRKSKLFRDRYDFLLLDCSLQNKIMMNYREPYDDTSDDLQNAIQQAFSKPVLDYETGKEIE